MSHLSGGKSKLQFTTLWRKETWTVKLLKHYRHWMNGVLQIAFEANRKNILSDRKQTYLEHNESIFSQSRALHREGGGGTRISSFEMGIFDVSHCLVWKKENNLGLKDKSTYSITNHSYGLIWGQRSSTLNHVTSICKKKITYSPKVHGGIGDLTCSQLSKRKR